jgi:(S)-2-hydroxy-acid oxidase
MTNGDPGSASRRAFFRSLALVTGYGAISAFASECWAEETSPSASAAPPASPDLITGPEKALDIFELEAVARSKLPPAHFGFLASGVDGDKTLQANRDAFDRWYIRPRRVVDVTKVDTSVELFGTRWPTPIILAPISGQRAFDPEGEIASARAARAGNHLQILSTVASIGIEDVTQARGAPLWFQLYPTTRWELAERLVRRAMAAEAAAIVVTADNPAAPNRETQYKLARLDSRDCKGCHVNATDDLRRKPMFAGTDVTSEQFRASNLTWDVVARLRDLAKRPLLIKGILTAEDAHECVRHDVDGIIVSNHGGRSIESGRATLEALPEVVEAVSRKIPVLVDSGFRRGSDMFKGLALGADAICVGRPYVWGLAAFGQAGVERALAILRGELENIMRHAGATSLAGVTHKSIGET